MRTSVVACVIGLLCVVPAMDDVRAACDTSAPVLVGFDLSPSTVDVTTGDAIVTCSMTLTKSGPRGVSSMSCQLTNFTARAGCQSSVPANGSPWNGTYSCQLRIPRGAAWGRWVIDGMWAGDDLGNSISYSPQQLEAMGFPSGITVTDSNPDITPPSISNVTLDPPVVDVTSADATVTCSFDVSDDRSPIRAASCSLSIGYCSVDVLIPPAGRRVSCPIVVRRGSNPKVGTVYEVGASDLVGNTSRSHPDLTVTVTDAAPDTTRPRLNGFDFQPRAADPKGAPTPIRCAFYATDVGLGVASAACEFMPTSGQYQWAFCEAEPDASGLLSCTAALPLGAAPGAWKVTRVDVLDKADNWIELDTDALAARGFPNTLTVSCTAPAEDGIHFNGIDTLGWHIVEPGSRQNVYRGAISDLVDANHDGLPDKGYGTCQNARDPDLFDGVFVDTDRPAEGKGFFYDVSYTVSGTEKGLGYTSAERARSVKVACP